MWATFKKIVFGSAGPLPRIHPLVFQDGLLAFRASQPLQTGKVQVLAPGCSGEFKVEVEVVSFDAREDAYRARVADEVFVLDAMRLERRREFRLSESLRVTSSDLPGYEALTEDLSLSGARLALKKPIKEGDYGVLTLHFQNSIIADIEVRFECCWCAEKSPGNYHCGIKFMSMERAHKQAIKRFIENRVALGGA